MESSYKLVSQTVSAEMTFVYAMIKYPEIQKRAQEELDRVIKPGHLPVMEDEESLPYTTAILKEVLRWKPVAPIGLNFVNSYLWMLNRPNTGVPHCSLAEDVYNGYRIPAGSLVVGNAW